MNKQIFKRGLGLLVSCFPDKDFNSTVYWELLQDLSDKAYLKAVKEVCQSQLEIYPGTNIIAIIRQKATVKLHLLAGEAWGKILKALQGYPGKKGSPDFGDPVINKAVDCVGWKQLFNSEKLSIERVYFVKVYEQLVERENKEDVLALPEGGAKLIPEVQKNV